MGSVRCTFYKVSLLGAALFGLIAAGIPGFGQQPDAEKTGVPDDWTHHHLIFSNPGTASQAISDGRFLDWYKTDANLRYRFQQLKRGAAPTSNQQSTGGFQAEEAVRRDGPFRTARGKKNVLKRDWSSTLGGSTAFVAPGMTGAFWNANPKTDTPSCSDYIVFGVDATPGTSQPNIVGLSNLYNTTCTGTVPNVLFAYHVGTGPVITSPTLGLASGAVLYIESASAAVLHILKGAGTGSSNGTVSAPAVPGTGNTASDTAITLNGSPTVTYSSVFYDYGSDTAYVGDDNGYLHKFAPVFAAAPQEVLVPSGAVVWPALVSTGTKLTSPVLDPGSGRIWVSDGSKLYSVSPTYGSGTGSAIVASASLGSNIVDAPIVDGGNGFVYVFVGSVPEVAEFSTSGFPSTTHTATVGTGSTTVQMYDGDFNNTYYSSANGSGTLYACGDPGGNPTLYSVTVTAGALSAPTAGPVLANANAACSPLVEYYNTSGTAKDWLFAGVPANSCGATGGTTAGGCVMSFNITSGVPTIGPWMPSYAFPASAEIVDTSGNLQKCTVGCGATGGNSGTTPPTTWGTTTNATTNDNVVNASALGTVGSQVTSGTPTVTVGTLTLQATAPVAEVATISVPSSTYCIPPGGGVSVGTGPSSVTTNATASTATVTFNSTSISGDTLVVGGVTYSWVTTVGSTANQILVGSGSSTTGHAHNAQNLYAAINAKETECSNAPANCFGTNTTANPGVTASWTSGTATSLTAICAGTANNITISGTGTGTGGTSDEQYAITAASTNGTTSGTSHTFALPNPNSNTGLATNINTGIGTVAGLTHSVASSTITLTASVPGTTGFTNALVGAVTGVSDAVTTTGSNGNSTPPNFVYWAGNVAVSTNTLASNIAAAAAGNANIAVAYNSGTNTFTASGTGTNAGAAGNAVAVGGNLTGLTWTNGGTSTTTLKGGTGIVWTCQSASNGQTTVAAPTGSSGLIVDNSGTGGGEANIYFGTLSGTGATHAAIKLSQSGLQ